jgi:hypothetical protein
VNYDEMIERLNSVVGSEIWILLWSGSDKQGVVASLSGILERAESASALTADRLQITETMDRQGVPPEIIEETLEQREQLVDAVRHRRETGEWPPDMPGAIAVAERDSDAGRSEGFVILVAGHRAMSLYFEEDQFVSADYDRDGLTVKFAGTALTFMKVYRQKPRRPQAQRRP